METQIPSDSSPNEHELARLRAEFPGHRIFRGKRWDGRPASWVACLCDPDAGVDPTLIRSTCDELRAALRAEREAAAAGKRPMAVDEVVL